MASDFCLLTMQALSGPFGYIRVHGWPNYLRSDCFASSFNPWVSEAVDGVEELSAERLRNERTGRAVAAVDDQVVSAEINVFEV